KELAMGFRYTTNNRMELLAVIAGLEALITLKQDVVIYSDSKYVVDTVSKGWIWAWIKNDFKGKKNKDLWLRFLKVYNKHNVRFVWVKGHANNEFNNKCDVLAVEASKQKDLLIDFEYEASSKNEEDNNLYSQANL
ncbi:MAG: ribonuclease HI, partial [Bacteroidetes bacterium GWE2_29_8]